MRIVVATHNPGKAREFRSLLGSHDVLLLPDEIKLPPETAETFAGNAIVKARVACETTGLPAVGDDSGLCCEALDGKPGVRSARYAGEHATTAENIALLRSRAPAGSAACFMCVLAFVHPDGRELLVTGTCEGRITHKLRGSNGFAYDVMFEPNEYPGRTMAELTSEQKHAISHRGRATRSLLAQLENC